MCPLPGAPPCSGPLPLPGAPLCSGPLPLPGAPLCSGPLPLLPGVPLPVSGAELGEGEPCPGADDVRWLQASVSVEAKFEDSKHGVANSGYGNTDGTQDSTDVQLRGEGVWLLDEDEL